MVPTAHQGVSGSASAPSSAASGADSAFNTKGQRCRSWASRFREKHLVKCRALWKLRSSDKTAYRAKCCHVLTKTKRWAYEVMGEKLAKKITMESLEKGIRLWAVLPDMQETVAPMTSVPVPGTARSDADNIDFDMWLLRNFRQDAAADTGTATPK